MFDAQNLEIRIKLVLLEKNLLGVLGDSIKQKGANHDQYFFHISKIAAKTLINFVE